MEPDYTLLASHDIWRENDNARELLDVKCRRCQVREQDQREILSGQGWTLAVETRLEGHEGFPLCGECSKRSWSWEDLY